MNWGSAQAFFDMGGYGLYVWGSYGMTALGILLEVYLVRRRRHMAEAQSHRRQLLDEDNT